MKSPLLSPLAAGAVLALATSTLAFGRPATPMQQQPAASQQASQGGVTGQDADNTRLNRRDRNASSATATQQSNDSAALQLVAQVRQAIVHDDSLSMKAHNIKVIANNGVVTLRGPVSSAQEKSRVEQDVSGVSGVSRIDNQLDIDTDD